MSDDAHVTHISQSARDIPLVRSVDVLVVGGTTGAVAAAVEAVGRGRSVLLLAPRPYLGEDLCATLRLWLEEGERADGALTSRIFGDGKRTTPLNVKRALSRALMDARVEFFLACHVTDVLRDGAGEVAGVVVANRAGRQAVGAKVVVDATRRSAVARAAGGGAGEWRPGTLAFKRVVIGGARRPDAPGPARSIPLGDEAGAAAYHEYEIEVDAPGGDVASLSRAERVVRDLTYRTGQLRAAEWCTFAPPDAITDVEGAGRVRVLAPSADAARSEVERLGRDLGARAASDAASIAPASDVRVASVPGEGAAVGDVKETLVGLRPTDRGLPTVPAGASSVPVWGSYDVVVAGGGNAGCGAAIGAARRGARVLVLEYQDALGGVGTIGLIGSPYHGSKAGFSAEVPWPGDGFNLEDKMEWYRRQIIDAGGEVWFGAMACGAVVEGARVRGVVVSTPHGRGVVLANSVVDATGSADVAIAAGAGYMFGADADDIALQGVGLPKRPLGKDNVNSDYLLVDEADVVDVTRTLVGAPAAMPDAYDAGTLIQTRERRRVVGDHVLSYLDQIAGRTYPDTVVLSASDYDAHGYPSLPYFALIPHDEETRTRNHPAPGGTCYTPYRCLLPRGLDGIVVAGIGISMHRDASAMVRMQHDISNQGYAAGVAAAMAASLGGRTRDVDVKALQRHLVEIGNVPASVLEDVDSHPLPAERVERAVRELAGDGTARRDEVSVALAIVLSHASAALPLLRGAYLDATGDARRRYALSLAVLGDATPVGELVAALEEIDAWDDRIPQGNMAEYSHLPTPVDALVLALGHAGGAAAVDAIVRKVETLTPEVTLSHHRSVALALSHLGDARAAEPLRRLLEKPGMSGHAMTDIEPLYDRQRERRRRTGPLREITLARALYRCGDSNHVGRKILEEYTRDVRGLFARHAAAVLAPVRHHT